MEIFLFRHGQTTFNRDKKFTGQSESKLTTQGKNQAKIISKKLKTKKFQVAIHTNLSRSKDTLNLILKSHPECKLILQDNRITERSYGKLEKKSHNKIIKKFGEKKFNQWHRDWSTQPPSGESFKNVEKRVKPFIKDLKKFMKKNQVSVAISSHGNSIRLFRKIMEKLPIKKTCELSIPYDKIFIYKI